jgi:hypothetical protein
MFVIAMQKNKNRKRQRRRGNRNHVWRFEYWPSLTYFLFCFLSCIILSAVAGCAGLSIHHHAWGVETHPRVGY